MNTHENEEQIQTKTKSCTEKVSENRTDLLAHGAHLYPNLFQTLIRLHVFEKHFQ